jgi:hypothetical protein
MSPVLASFLGGLAYLAGWCIASCLAAYREVYVLRRRDPQMPPDDEFFLRTVGGCAFLPIPVIGFAVGSMIGNFWSWGWHLQPWWGLPIGAVHLLLLSAMTALEPVWKTRRRMWTWFCLWLAYLLAVPSVIGVLFASNAR